MLQQPLLPQHRRDGRRQLVPRQPAYRMERHEDVRGARRREILAHRVDQHQPELVAWRQALDEVAVSCAPVARVLPALGELEGGDEGEVEVERGGGDGRDCEEDDEGFGDFGLALGGLSSCGTREWREG